VEFKELGSSGLKIPVLGLGTWKIGGGLSRSTRDDHESLRALRLGLELGMRFIDTAEMYGSGHSEEIVAKVVHNQRDNVFVSTKVSQENLHYDDVIRACESSLRRLNMKHVDLYQVHWPNETIPITETMKAMEHLVTEGKVRHIGVSNFSLQQTREAQEALSKNTLASNQVEYSLLERSIEADLLNHAEKEHITIIAYTPVAKGQIARGGNGERWHILDQIASKYRKTRTQVALNWLLEKQPVMAIPKAVSPEHMRENAGAVGWRMSRENHDRLSAAFR
jgi:diketogulonate reductase-like aldo/keto reductase